MLIGVLAEGQAPTADQLSDGILTMNDMLDSWSTESLIIPAITIEKFTLVPGTARYSIGVGGDFNTARPISIENVTLESQSASPVAEYQLERVNATQWSGIVQKATQTSIPSKVYIEGTSPLDHLNLYPTPNIANKVVIYSLKPLTAITDGNTVLDVQPGYSRALRYNLAIELAPEYGKAVSQEVAMVAADSKGNLKRANMKEHLLETDDALAGSRPFNIVTGV